ncbi:MAG: hypothetical protein M1839_008184 [Geoglossum umbratile]|nr:MAG: hypothetical protein M1839_008184 [Geoglossum umbratile]
MGTDGLSVWFDGGREHRHYHATPLPTPLLRIPITWYRSFTLPLYPDETPTTIRRVSPSLPFTLRHFCGYCGTPLSYWRENPTWEKDYISVTLGSLWGGDVKVLEEMGVLPGESEESGEEEDEEEVYVLDGDWLGKMVEGSRLARILTKQKPPHPTQIHRLTTSPITSSKSNITVEWEIMEWSSDDESDPVATTTTTTTITHSTKRKISEISELTTLDGKAITTEVEMTYD